MANVGYATLQIIPSAQGFSAALMSQTAAPMAGAGKKSGQAYGGAFGGSLTKMAGVAAGAFAAVGVAGVIKDSVQLEASFSKTMAMMGAAAGVPKKGLAELSDLAMEMGAQTTFSAGEAADAMLELAKGGISVANIKAGALKGTMTLAAAGTVDLGTAATIASNAMNMFGLKGKDMGKIAAALAGGANASSASVESLGQALSQVGPGAAQAGMSLQTTVGILSAFDAAGIKGSDAGTSLKTMLTRLVPSTKGAADAMADLGLKFTDANGQFLPMTDIAEQLKTKMSGLSDAQRTSAMATIFGADATRAATQLMHLGADGVKKYTAAASDMGAAEALSKAAMSGTAGALESLSGSFETVKLKAGQFLAPAVQAAADFSAKALNKIGPAIDELPAKFAAVSDAIKDMIDGLRKADGQAGFLAGIQDILKNDTLPAFQTVAGFIRSDVVPALREIITNAGEKLAPVLKTAAEVFRTDVLPALSQIGDKFRELWPTIEPVLRVMVDIAKAHADFAVILASKVLPPLLEFGGWLLKTGTPAVLEFIGMIVRAGAWLADFGLKVLGALRDAWQFAEGVKAAITTAWDAIRTTVGAAVTWISDFVGAKFAALRAMISAAWTAIQTATAAAWNAIKAVVAAVILALVAVVTGDFGTIRTIITAAWNAIRSSAETAWNAIRNAVTTAINAIKSALSSIGGVISSVLGFFDRLRAGIADKLGAAVALVQGIPGKIRGALGSVGGMLYGAGADIVQGLANGISGAAGRVMSAVRNLVSGVPAAARSLLGIGSPSKVFASIGKDTARGFVLGLDKNAGAAQAAIGRVVAAPAAPALRGTIAARGTPTAGGGGFTGPLIGTAVLREEIDVDVMAKRLEFALTGATLGGGTAR